MATSTASRAYIVSGSSVIATVETSLPAGASVKYGWNSTRSFDANRPNGCLVNARTGRISRAKKYEEDAQYADGGREIYTGEFLLNAADFC